MEGHLPSCSICLAPVSAPTFTRCVHLACADCLISWLQAAPIVDEGARAQAERERLAMLNYTASNEEERRRLIARERCAPCMLCRQPFSISQLIRVDPEEAKLSNDEAASGGGKKKSKRDRRNQNELEDEDEKVGEDSDGERKELVYNPILQTVAEFEPPRCTPTFSKDIVCTIPSVNTGHVLRSPNLVALDSMLLTQLNVATGVPANASAKMLSKPHRSPKIKALLRVLKPVIKSNNGTGKAVVFSQNRAAIAHVATILKQERIGCVKIVRGDMAKAQTEAVQKWNVDPTIPIFLLHAGTAAAGLTLTAASHVILLEPFNSRGEEQQALNRTHRIGQTMDVVCTTLYCRNTVEERMLAYRNSQEQNSNSAENNAANALTVLSGDNQSSVTDNDRELEFILGMVAH